MTTQTNVLPDDAPFDRIAWATGAEGYDHGVTWEQLAAMDALLERQEEPQRAMLAWRRSYCEGYLAAMHVKAVR